MTMIGYPEHDKFKAKQPDIDLLRAFGEWLARRGIELGTMVETTLAFRLVPATETFGELVHEYLEIDPEELERERRMMLHQIREASDRSETT